MDALRIIFYVVNILGTGLKFLGVIIPVSSLDYTKAPLAPIPLT